MTPRSYEWQCGGCKQRFRASLGAEGQVEDEKYRFTCPICKIPKIVPEEPQRVEREVDENRWAIVTKW